MIRSALITIVLASLSLLFAPLVLAAPAPQETSVQLQQVDINSADAATIAANLEGIGMAKAREIVAYREMFGSFRSVDELLEVNGIGAVTLERNRHRIQILSE